MSEFLAENDRRLASALYSVWLENQKSASLDEGIRLFDRLRALEVRTPGSAADSLRKLTGWLGANGIMSDPRAKEIELFLTELAPVRTEAPASEDRSMEEKLTVVVEPTSRGRVELYDELIQPASEIRSQPPRAPWREMKDAEKEKIIGRVSPIDGEHVLDANTSAFASVVLPWYENVSLIRITDAGWAPEGLVVYFLELGDELFRLDGASPPIHEVNARAPITLSEDNAVDYLKFFCFFVRGEEGPFFLLESSDDPWIPETEDPLFPSTIASSAAPVEYVGHNAAGHYRCDATVFYADALFKANFEVHPTGMVEMIDDEPVAGDLAGRIDAPLN